MGGCDSITAIVSHRYHRLTPGQPLTLFHLFSARFSFSRRSLDWPVLTNVGGRRNYSRDQEAIELRAQLDRLEGLLGMLGGAEEPLNGISVGGIASGSRSVPMESAPRGKVRSSHFERERDSAAEALGLLAVRCARQARLLTTDR